MWWCVKVEVQSPLCLGILGSWELMVSLTLQLWWETGRRPQSHFGLRGEVYIIVAGNQTQASSPQPVLSLSDQPFLWSLVITVIWFIQLRRCRVGQIGNGTYPYYFLSKWSSTLAAGLSTTCLAMGFKCRNKWSMLGYECVCTCVLECKGTGIVSRATWVGRHTAV